MMNFRIIQQAIVSILGAAAAGRFQTIGYQRQTKGASEVRGSNRMVQCFFSEGAFPKTAGRMTGPTQHNMTFSIGLTVSAPATADLTTINNPASTSAQISAALLAMQEASSLADESFDELAEIVYQILMDGLNLDLGLSKGGVSNRWVTAIRKDAPAPQGSLVVLTGSVEYTCNAAEQVTGDTGVACEIISTQLDIIDDDVERTGVDVATTT